MERFKQLLLIGSGIPAAAFRGLAAAALTSAASVGVGQGGGEVAMKQSVTPSSPPAPSPPGPLRTSEHLQLTCTATVGTCEPFLETGDIYMSRKLQFFFLHSARLGVIESCVAEGSTSYHGGG